MSKMNRLLALLLVLCLSLGMLAGCGPKDPDNSQNPGSTNTPGQTGDNNTPAPTDGPGAKYTITEFDPNATYTQRGALSELPGNWNMHDYESDTASTIFSPLTDSLYNISYNDELHPVEGKEPWKSYTILPAMAAAMPKDVTAEVKAAHPEWFPAGATKGYAWEIPLRQDLYFDTGYHITAETYVQGAKYVLDPRLNNYRAADLYNGGNGIVGADAYFLQGKSNFNSFNAMGTTYSDYIAAGHTDDEVYIDLSNFWGIAYEDGTTWGKITDDTLIRDPAVAEGQKEDYVSAKYLWDNYLSPNGAYAGSGYDLEYVGTVESFANNVTFEDTVGIYAKDEYTLVQVLRNPQEGFYLYYGGIQDTLLLVEPDVYESCLKQDESGAWYCTYMTSKETSPSYGAYSMTGYQTDKQVTYAKNDKWYGWTDDVNHVYKDPNDGNVYRSNMTTNIEYQVIGEAATRRQLFLAGQLTSFNLEETDFETYGKSDYAVSYPSETTAGIWLTGNLKGLQAREAADGFNKATQDTETISLTSFHKAMAISFNKQAFCDEVHPAYLPGFGLLGDQFIYDADTGSYYRDSDEAKQALCDFYSVDVSKFASLDDAVDSITGYDPEGAKVLYQEAFEEALELGYITSADGKTCDQTITMLFIIQAANDVMTRRVNFLNNSLKEVTKGTPFEGKLVVVESSPLGNGWLDAYRTGEADMFIVGVGGSMFNPFNAMGIYCDPAQNLTANWYDPKSDMITLTIKGEEITMSVYNWYQAVNGSAVTVGGKEYEFSSATAEPSVRLTILAALESKIMQRYDMLPLCNFGAKGLLSMQCFNVLDEYNAMFEYGPRRYNYSDAEWAEFVEKQIAEHGQLQY